MEIMPPSPLSAGNSKFQMVDVGGKTVTRRRAVAQGTLLLTAASFRAVQDGTNPKGDVLAIAEIAGIQAVKRTSDWIPLCHPLAIDQTRLWFDLNPSANSVTVHCEVCCEAKTGVEMEALCGVQAALLTLYDLSKAVDPVLTITDIRLDLKEGGKHGTWKHPQAATPAKVVSLAGLKVSVITVGDRVSQGSLTNHSGKALVEQLTALLAHVVNETVVPDEQDLIASLIRKEVIEGKVDLVILSGGTGLGPRDVTPEAVSQVCPRLIPGFGELLRKAGSHDTPMAWLSRSVVGILDGSLVISLPGSQRAVEAGLTTLAPLLKHALETAKGANHEKPL